MNLADTNLDVLHVVSASAMEKILQKLFSPWPDLNLSELLLQTLYAMEILFINLILKEHIYRATQIAQFT